MRTLLIDPKGGVHITEDLDHTIEESLHNMRKQKDSELDQVTMDLGVYLRHIDSVFYCISY